MARKDQSDKRPQPPDADETASRVIELLNQGARLLASQRPGEAMTSLQEAQRLDPDNVAIAINLGGAYIMQRKYRQAVPILERAVELEPGNAMAWMNLAAAYLGRLELSTRATQDRAIAAFERAVQLDGTLHNVHYNLGLIYHDRGENLRACAHFQRVLEIHPADRDARYWLKRLQQSHDNEQQPTGDA